MIKTFLQIFKPENLAILTVVGLPLYLAKVRIFGFPVNVLDILLVMAIGYRTVVDFSSVRKSFTRFAKSDYFVPVSFIFFGVTVSIFKNPNTVHNWSVFKSWIVLPIVFAFLFGYVYKSDKKTEKFLNAICFSGVVVSLIAISFAILNHFTYDHRLKAFYLSPNHLAMYLSPAFVICFWRFLFFKNERFKRLFIGFALLILGSIIYLTYSYSAWMAIIVGITIVLMIFKRNNFKKMLTGIVLILALLLVTQIFNPKFQELIFNNNQEVVSSLMSRRVIWKSASRILSDNWLWGIGIDNFQAKYLEYQKFFPPYPEWAVPQPHNIYLTFWLYGGMLGMLGFVFLAFLWVKNQVKSLIECKKTTLQEDVVILLSVMLYILIHGLTDTPYWKNDLAVIFWLIIFLGVGKTVIAEKKSKSFAK